MERKDMAWLCGCPGFAHSKGCTSGGARGGPPVCPPACRSPRIVCAIEAAEAPFSGGVEVDVNGKLGHSPPHVQFTYQVSTWQVGLAG